MVFFSNIFSGGAIFARTQHASRKWEWRFRVEVDTWHATRQLEWRLRA